MARRRQYDPLYQQGVGAVSTAKSERRSGVVVFGSFFSALDYESARSFDRTWSDCPSNSSRLHWLQPIDVGIGKPFKDRVRSNWWNFMAKEKTATEVARGINAKTMRQLAIRWVHKSWVNLPNQIVKNAWRKSGGFSYFVDEMEDESVDDDVVEQVAEDDDDDVVINNEDDDDSEGADEEDFEDDFEDDFGQYL